MQPFEAAALIYIILVSDSLSIKVLASHCVLFSRFFFSTGSMFS